MTTGPSIDAVPQLETPVLLLAMPQVMDPYFHKSVILLLRHEEEEGSLGFIVNRPTDLKIAEILEDLEIPWHGAHESRAYFGGPVSKERGTLLYLHPEPLSADDLAVDPSLAEEAREMGLGNGDGLQGIAVSQSLGQLQDLAESPPGEFRLYLGHAGWDDGQLEEEILRNDWLIAPFDPQLVFAEDPDEVWSTAVQSVGIDPSQLPAWTPRDPGVGAN